MINKIKQSVEKRRESIRNKISIFFPYKETEKDRLSQIKKQKVVHSGRIFRANKIASNLDGSSRENKQSLWNINDTSISQSNDFKNKLLAHIKKSKQKQQELNKTYSPFNSYIPKLKHKRSKEHSRRSLPSVNFDQNDEHLEVNKPRKVSQILIGSPCITQLNEQEKYSKMNHLSILMAGGRKKKIDSVMYMKKLKTKNQLNSTVITQSYMANSGRQQQQDCMSIRPLFLRKDLASYKRSNTSLNRKSQRKLSPQIHSKKRLKQSQNCRPWSATLSEYQK